MVTQGRFKLDTQASLPRGSSHSMTTTRLRFGSIWGREVLRPGGNDKLKFIPELAWEKKYLIAGSRLSKPRSVKATLF